MKQKSDDGRRIEKWKRKQNVNAQYIHRENLKISNTEKKLKVATVKTTTN